MRFSRTTEHAIRVMVFLAKNKNQRFSVNQLHQKLDIPYKYLGRLMRKLATAEFVDVSLGKQGGYQIKANLTDIFLYQIIEVVEGLENYDRCILGFTECDDTNPCCMHKFWVEHREGIKQMLYSATLEDLIKDPNIRF